VIKLFKCPHCKQNNAVKAGIRKNKSGFVRKLFCKDCNKFFTDRKGFENCQTKPEIIVDALDLRAKGLSFGKIVIFLNQKYHVNITRSAILKWQNKFGKIINDFTQSFLLPNCINIHADEIFFRSKGQRDRNFVYYWDAIDYDTKFLVADHISLEREEAEAKIFMKNIKQKIKELPKNIHTDNSYDYPPAIRKTFGRGKVKHIHFAAWKMKFKNNPIERYHNTVKENYKVMRRFQNEKTAKQFLTFFKNYYNFLRPHKTLMWKTPSQVAGFGIWNWWTLIRIEKIIYL
jgi:transposase-like protein